MVLTVSLPYPRLHAMVADALAFERDAGAVELIPWGLRTPAPPREIDLVVLPFHLSQSSAQAPYVSTDVLAETIPTARGVRLLQTESIGYEGLPPLVPAGAVLCNASGVMERQTAELAVALLLALRRNLPGFIADQGSWRNRQTPGIVGKRIVLLGFGGVGVAVHRRLVGFDAELCPIAQTARVQAGIRVAGIDRLPELARSADAIVITLPLTEQTHCLIDADLLAELPDGASIVNVGRGPVVDTGALIAEIASGRLTAALDVTDPEPLPDGHPLWHLPGALVTPHVGGNTDAMQASIARLIVDQARRVLDDRVPRNIVVTGTLRVDEDAS